MKDVRSVSRFCFFFFPVPFVEDYPFSVLSFAPFSNIIGCIYMDLFVALMNLPITNTTVLITAPYSKYGECRKKGSDTP